MIRSVNSTAGPEINSASLSATSAAVSNRDAIHSETAIKQSVMIPIAAKQVRIILRIVIDIMAVVLSVSQAATVLERNARL